MKLRLGICTVLAVSFSFYASVSSSAWAACGATDITANISVLGQGATGDKACENATRVCNTRGGDAAADDADAACAAACSAQQAGCTFTVATPITGSCEIEAPGAFPLAPAFGCYVAGTWTITCGCQLQ
jgi:hypothetical protein